MASSHASSSSLRPGITTGTREALLGWVDRLGLLLPLHIRETMAMA
jgi:hypothetical protein